MLERQTSHHEVEQVVVSRVIKILQAANYNLLSMLAAYLSLIIVTYHVAFQANSLTFLLIVYGLDVLHTLKLVIGFYMPYQNNLGELITDRHMIRKRYF